MRQTRRESGGHRARPASIRFTVVLLFAVSVVAAVALLAGYEAAVSSWFRGETNALTRLFRTPPSFARSSLGADEILRRLNIALLDGPVAVRDPEFLAGLSRASGPHLGIALRIGGVIEFAQPLLPKDFSPNLPAYGSLVQPEPFAEGAEEKLLVIRQMDFRGEAGEECSLFILREPSPGGRREPYTRQLAFIAALFLLAADGAAGVYLILRVTGPLKRLESAALRMSSGDLDTQIASGSRFAELDSAFAALETARERIGLLLRREREEEAARRELIANLSHDLRTPLAAVRGYVEGLRDGVADTPEKRARYLEVASDKVRLLDRMIEELLLLATLETDGAPPECRPVELGAFLKTGIEELSLAIPPGEAVIRGALEAGDAVSEGARTRALPPEVPNVALVDPQKLRRVIENLVDNAIRHGAKRPVTIEFGLLRDGGTAEIRVDDDGRGIPAAERNRVFERFYKGEAERPVSGAGLGLAVARKLVEGMGGTVEAGESDLGGARISIRLPLLEGAP